MLFLTSWNTNNVYADSRNVTSGESIAKNNNPQEGNPAVNKDNVQIVDNDSTEESNISDSKSSKVIKSDATKSDIVRDKTTIDDNGGTKVPELTAQANNKQALTTVIEDNGAKVSKTEKYNNSDIKSQSKNSEKTQETTLVKKVLGKEKLSSKSLIDQKKLDGKVEITATDPSNYPSNYPSDLNGKYIYQVLSLDSGSKLILSVNRNNHNDKNIYAYVTDGNFKSVTDSITIGVDQDKTIKIDRRKYKLKNNGSSEVSINDNKTVSTQNSSTVTSEPGYFDNLPISQDYGLGNTSNGNCSAIGEIVPVFTTNSVIKYYYRDNERHLQEFKNSELPNVSVEGFTGQEFEINNADQYKRVIQGYHLTSDNLPKGGNFKGTLSQFSDGKYYKKVYYDFDTDTVECSVLYHQISPDGTMKVYVFDGSNFFPPESDVIAPNGSTEFSDYNLIVRNPYVTATSHEVQFIYAKNGKIIPVDKDGHPIKDADQPVFPTDPKDPSRVVSGKIPDLSAMGYHPLTGSDQVDPDPEDPSKDITVTYVKSGTVTVKYHDTTEDTDIKDYGVNVQGNEDDPFNYDPATDLAKLEGKGYVLDEKDNKVPDIPTKFTATDQIVTIHLKHGTVTVTTENPQTPNAPINPDPQSPKYPEDINNTNKDVNRTINYKFKDDTTAQPTVTDSLHFERTVVIDKVTGDVVSDAWTPSQNFSDIQTPAIQGYTPDRTAVSDKNIGHDHQDIIEDVVYSPDVQHMTITYIDDTTGETLHTDNPNGVSDQDAKYTTSDTIKKYEDQHYKLISDSTKGQDLIFDHDDDADQTYEVHFVHNTHAISQTTSPKQTIHYVYANGLARQDKAADDNVQQLSFKRDGYNDEVTGIDHWNAWTPANSQYEAVNSPVIQGYTPDKLVVDKSTVNPTDKDIEVTVIYSADRQAAHVIYIDKTTNTTLVSKDLSGNSDKDSGYNTEDKIGQYKSQHYVLFKDETNGKNVIFDHNDQQDQTYYVYFVHGTQKVNRQDTVTSTIDYKFEDGTTAQPTVTQTKHFSENGVKDLVTNKITWDEAKPQKFEDVATKSIVGYTPNKDNVVGSTVKFGDKDIEVTVTYHNNAQKASVTYIDDKTGKTLKVDNLNGVTNAKSGYTTKAAIDTYTGLGYTLVSDDTNGNEVVFDNDDANDQAFTVHLSHGTITVTPENPGKPGEPINPGEGSANYPDGTDKTGLTDTVNRTITYVMIDGSKAPDAVHDSLSYTASKVIDKVNGEVLETKWSANQDFKDVDSPSVKGYTPDKKTVSNKNVAHDAADITETVKYSADAQKASVTYIDDKTGKTLKVDNLNGVTNAKSGYTTKAAIDTYTGLGYTLVSDDTNGNEVVFDNDDANDQAFTVHLSHGTTTVTPDNPGHPGEPVDPDNPDGPKYPDGTEEYQVKRTGTQIIHYVGASDKTPADNKQTFIFTREITFDNVTGKIISKTPWNVQSYTFGKVDTPVIPGYHADKAVAGGETVTPDDLNKVITVTYAPDGGSGDNPGSNGGGDQGTTPTPEPVPEPTPSPDDQPDTTLPSDNNTDKDVEKDKQDKPEKVKKARKIIKTRITKQEHIGNAEKAEPLAEQEHNNQTVASPVKNEANEPQLPQTGEANTSAIGLLGMLVAGFAAILGFESSRSRKHKN